MPFLFLLQCNQAVEAGRSYAFCRNRKKVYRQRKKKEEMSSPMGWGAHHYQNGTMKVLELFAGTRSIGKAFEQRGHEVFSVEWSKDFENIDLYEDISKVTAEDILKLFGKPDVIWASPDCATFSIAAISHHRKKNPETGSLEPVSAWQGRQTCAGTHWAATAKVLFYRESERRHAQDGMDEEPAKIYSDLLPVWR